MASTYCLNSGGLGGDLGRRLHGRWLGGNSDSGLGGNNLEVIVDYGNGKSRFIP